jgi:hypothetical protein
MLTISEKSLETNYCFGTVFPKINTPKEYIEFLVKNGTAQAKKSFRDGTQGFEREKTKGIEPVLMDFDTLMKNVRKGDIIAGYCTSTKKNTRFFFGRSKVDGFYTDAEGNKSIITHINKGTRGFFVNKKVFKDMIFLYWGTPEEKITIEDLTDF